MPFRLGVPELSILLIIVVLLFGVGRISKIGADLGKSIREFRSGISGSTESDKETK